MKIFKILTILFFILLAANIKAQELTQLDPISVGNLEILPIRDAEMSMDKNLLPDLAKYPDYAPAFDHGALPAVNQIYYLSLNDHQILFDTGWGDNKIKGKALEILQKYGISPDNITDILLTHLDIDHIGGLLRQDEIVFPNATIWISRPEFEAWIKDQVNRNTEQAKKVIAKYENHIKLFDNNQEILPGITAILAPGHTPGHTAYEISSGQDKLIIGGDLLHIWQIQLPVPQLSTIYDYQPDEAAATREKILDKASSEKLLLAGSHFPMISPVIKRSDGGFNMRTPR